MENNEALLMENTTIHTKDLSKRYLKSLQQNFIGLIIFMVVLSLISLFFAVTDYEIAYVPFGFSILAIIFIIFINTRSLKAGVKSLSEYEGTIYHFMFYQTYFTIDYKRNDEEASDRIDYKMIKNGSRINSIFSLGLFDNRIFLIDELTINNKDEYNNVIMVIKKYIELNTKLKKK